MSPRPDEWYDALADYFDSCANDDDTAAALAWGRMDELDTLRAVFDNAAMLRAAYPDDEEYAAVARIAEQALRDEQAAG